MRVSYNLSPHDLQTILESWGRTKGLQGEIQVVFHYTPGDRPGDSSVVTATVSTEDRLYKGPRCKYCNGPVDEAGQVHAGGCGGVG